MLGDSSFESLVRTNLTIHSNNSITISNTLCSKFKAGQETKVISVLSSFTTTFVDRCEVQDTYYRIGFLACNQGVRCMGHLCSAPFQDIGRPESVTRRRSFFAVRTNVEGGGRPRWGKQLEPKRGSACCALRGNRLPDCLCVGRSRMSRVLHAVISWDPHQLRRSIIIPSKRRV